MFQIHSGLDILSPRHYFLQVQLYNRFASNMAELMEANSSTCHHCEASHVITVMQAIQLQ